MEPIISIPLSRYENQSLTSKIRMKDEYSDGSKYEGEKLYNLRDGFGRFYFKNGGRYEGLWK